jgi:hypothetical protein
MNNLSRFADALLSERPAVPEDAQLFAPMVGSWDLIVRWFDEAGKVSREEKGEWHFAWVLEGRAIQDVWIVPPRKDRSPSRNYEYGASVRFYDENLNAWRSTWIGPAHKVVHTFLARAHGRQIVMETTPENSPRMRWSFDSITATGFTWKNEVFENDLWRIQQTFIATRFDGEGQ